MSSASANQVNISWTDATPITDPATYGDHSNEIGFVIERSANGGTFGAIGEAIANSTTYSDTTKQLHLPPLRLQCGGDFPGIRSNHHTGNQSTDRLPHRTDQWCHL